MSGLHPGLPGRIYSRVEDSAKDSGNPPGFSWESNGGGTGRPDPSIFRTMYHDLSLFKAFFNIYDSLVFTSLPS